MEARSEALVRAGEQRAILRGEIEELGRTVLIEIEIPPPARDRVQLNRQRVSRAHDLLEALRVTVFSPDDLVLVKGAPEWRRDYLDDTIVAAWPRKGTFRQTVDRVLRQRAVLLRQADRRLTPDIQTTLEVWDAQLSAAGDELVREREELVERLAPVAAAAFSQLAGTTGEQLQFIYHRSYDGSLRCPRTRAER